MNAAREYTTVSRSVDAIQWTGENQDAVREFARPVEVSFHDRGWMFLMSSPVGGVLNDWLVRQHDTQVLMIVPARVFEELYVAAEPQAGAASLDVSHETAESTGEGKVDPTLADA